MIRISALILLSVLAFGVTRADNGYRLWLRYEKISDEAMLGKYRTLITGVWIAGTSPTTDVIRNESAMALSGMLGQQVAMLTGPADASVIIAKISDAALARVKSELANGMAGIADDGFVIRTVLWSGKKKLIITSNSEIGLLYGTFHLIKLLQTLRPIDGITITSSPRVKIRILNHWDNLDRTVERGYAGISIFDWHKLPRYIDQRYHDYARANASIGINATVLTNVNANALVLTPMYLEKVKALADVFRPYGIKVYLTARFSAPMEIGGLKTADPLDETVQAWWTAKIREIYKYVPDFGGMVVKANSEGQPGPQNYGRSHADGANMLARALQPHGGFVMWRAFVYDNAVPVDRTKQAFNEFKPLDGKFDSNVIVQVKNGPLDFQPREPFHPLFGAMQKTAVMPEFQITQEYLGFATHLVYLATLIKECLDADTYSKGKGSTVARTMDGTLYGNSISAVAGVANIGNDANWTGHQFGQANWFAFGRLAWDHTLEPETIAEEWVRMTFSNNDKVVTSILSIMMASRETLVDYMTPLGLHHIMGYNHHFGPGPWVKNKQREDWTSVYYHRADSTGVGFDRSPSGSNALEQYHPEVRKKFLTKEACPEEYLLWFHHVPWVFKTKSGRILWDELCHRYYRGVEAVGAMQNTWRSLEGLVDEYRFKQVDAFLTIQKDEAMLWRDACVLYFQQFSKMPIPAGLEKPDHGLEYYEKLSFPYAPGIRPQW
ncbi:MAG TPA: alpha-glucuronidase family glycosyl hydrolase [Chryseosolibacter sp.]